MDTARPTPPAVSDPTPDTATDPTDGEPTVVPADQPSHPLPPARNLPVTGAVWETTRFVVGAGLLAGRGVSQIIRRFGTAESDPTRASGAESDPLATPVVLAGVARTLAIGATFEVERRVLDTADAVARATAPVAGAVVRSPVMAPISRAIADRLAGWYARGAMEEQKSREYAGSALLGVTKVGTDFIVEYLDVDAIVQSLSLDELILDSTGGITGEMLDTVRSQAVTLDSVVDRVTTAITRRKIHEGPRSKAEVKAAKRAKKAAKRADGTEDADST